MVALAPMVILCADLSTQLDTSVFCWPASAGSSGAERRRGSSRSSVSGPPNPPLTLTTPNRPRRRRNAPGGRTIVDAHIGPCYPMSSRQIFRVRAIEAALARGGDCYCAGQQRAWGASWTASFRITPIVSMQRAASRSPRHFARCWRRTVSRGFTFIPRSMRRRSIAAATRCCGRSTRCWRRCRPIRSRATLSRRRCWARARSCGSIRRAG